MAKEAERRFLLRSLIKIINESQLLATMVHQCESRHRLDRERMFRDERNEGGRVTREEKHRENEAHPLENQSEKISSENVNTGGAWLSIRRTEIFNKLLERLERKQL